MGACPAQTFKSGDNGDTSCTDWGTCGAGRGKLTAGTASTDIVCEDCSAADKEYSQEDDRSACQDHTTCGPGLGSNWETLDPSTQAESACVPCDYSQYSAVTGYGPCETRKTSCAAGEYFTAGSTTADATCTACDASHFKVGTNAVTSCAAKKTVCPPGEYFTASNVQTADATCTACASNRFKVGTNNLTSCTKKTKKCSAGYYLTESDDQTADNTCTFF